MKVKMDLEDVLQQKARKGVVTAQAHETMQVVVSKMVQNGIGAVIVCDEGLPVGIVTERDVLRLVGRTGANFLRVPVSEVMTREVVIGTYDDDVEAIKRLMTEKRFRHIPVLHDGKLVGLVSIGDLVHSQLTTAETEARYLRDYIAGAYS